MCGIAGFVTTETDKLRYERAKFLGQALFMNTLRGDDSAGIFYVPHKAEGKAAQCAWAKDIGPGSEFIYTEPYLNALKDLDDYAFVAVHNRAATQGTVTTDNAHPFQEGPITLIHNGTVDYSWGLPETMHESNKKRKKDSKKIEVDSHLIAHNLAIGERDDVLAGIQGAFALVWHDTRDDNLYIIRNDRRPLHLAQDKDSGTLYFMSEAEMLYAICKRNNINIGKMYQPDPGVLLRFKNGNLKPTAKKLTLGVYKNRNTGQSGGTGVDVPFVDARNRTLGTTTMSELRKGRRNYRNGGFVAAKTNDEDRSNWVMIGGRLQPVPIQSQETLLKYNMVIEDRFLMTPIEFKLYKNGDHRGLVLGDAHAGPNVGQITCLIHGVTQENWNQYSNCQWAVRPIAVNEMENGIIVVCRPESMFSEGAKRIVHERMWSLIRAEAARKKKSEGTDDPFDANGLLPGPKGIRVSLVELRSLIANGCYHCGKALTIVQATDLMWVNDGKFPVCLHCQEDWTIATNMAARNAGDMS